MAVLGAASIYCFYKLDFFPGIVIFVWFISKLFGYRLDTFLQGLYETKTQHDSEQKYNCSIDLRIAIENVLRHSAVDTLFEKLQMKNIISIAIKKEDWVNLMVENYKKKFEKDHAVDIVRFDIKHNILWKNGTVDFFDSVYHDIFIPYEYKNGRELEEARRESIPRLDEITIGIRIRIFIVNGFIKLQVGEYSKEFTPKMIKDDKYFGVYQRFETVTSFPLLYFSYKHRIPENYLNLTVWATQYGEDIMASKPNSIDNWREIQKDFHDYNYVCSVADEESRFADKKFMDIIARFREKRDAWLNNENFGDTIKRESRYWMHGISDCNSYMSIDIDNYNASDIRERREKYLYTDYCQGEPSFQTARV